MPLIPELRRNAFPSCAVVVAGDLGGNDVLTGSKGDHILYGGFGNDRLDEGNGNGSCRRDPGDTVTGLSLAA